MDKKEINVAICGYGLSGKVFHAPFIEVHPSFNLLGILERSKDEAKFRYPNIMTYRSLDQILKDPKVDLVVVNTPDKTHFEFVKKALQSGKNVIVEKPLTVTFQQAETLVEIAKKENRFISVFQNRRHDRDFCQVKKILASGVLGEIKEVEIRWDRYRPNPLGKGHKEDPNEPGSGILHDLGPHLIDQAISLFGKPDSIFADVFSMKGTHYANDYFEILMFYRDNLRVRLKSSAFCKEEHFAYKIHGALGSLLQERSDQQEYEILNGALPIYGAEWQSQLPKPDAVLHYVDQSGVSNYQELTSSAGDYMKYYDQIADYFLLDSPLPSPAEEVVLNMKVIDAVLLSNQKRQIIDFH